MKYLVMINTKERNYTILVDSIEDVKGIIDSVTRIYSNVSSINVYKLHEIMNHNQ